MTWYKRWSTLRRKISEGVYGHTTLNTPYLICLTGRHIWWGQLLNDKKLTQLQVLFPKFLMKYKRAKIILREIWQKPALKGNQRECYPQGDNSCHVLPEAMPSHGDTAQLHTCVMPDPERQTAQIQRHSANYVVLLFTSIKAIKNNKTEKRIRNIRKGKT